MTQFTKLFQLRNQQDLTQKEMAELLHIDQSTYSKYEVGKLQLNIDLAKRIAQKFNVDLNWLLTENGNTYIDIETNNGSVATNIYNEAPNELIEQILKQQELLTQLLQKILVK